MENDKKLGLGKTNLILILVAFAVIIIGFITMTGSTTTVQFNPDIFSTRRIVVGPAISFVGFIFMIFAIMYKPKSK
jgi:hypothetical protein